MDKLRALQYFIAAAEVGSLGGAARRLEVSVPSVHKLVTSLERSLGVRLFERTTRGVTLTASGVTYLESCQPLLNELMALDESVSRSATRPSGTLVIGTHPQIAHHLLLPSLARFHARCPDVQIDFRVIHRLTDPDASMVDVFLLHGWPEASDLVHHRLGRAKTLIVASPDYWAVHGVPRHPSDLKRHTCLLMRNPAGILMDLWEFVRDGAKTAITVEGWFSSNDREAVLDGVLAGEGVGRFSVLTTRTHLRSGRLVPVLVEWEVQGGPPLNLMFRANHRRTPRVRMFVDFVAALLGDVDADGMASEHASPVERPHWHRRGYGRASSVLRAR